MEMMAGKLKHPIRARKQSLDNYLGQLKYRKAMSHSVANSPKATDQTPKDTQMSPKKIDYLKELREKNNRREKEDVMVAGGLSKEEKIEVIRNKAAAFESKARIYEQGTAADGKSPDDQVNKLYMQSIKAKLAVLDEL